MTWLCCVVEKTPEHCIVTSKLYCAVCQNYRDRIHKMKHFLSAWITGSGNQRTSNVMDHAILSIVVVYSFINDCM